jgi:hypothetical protein
LGEGTKMQEINRKRGMKRSSTYETGNVKKSRRMEQTYLSPSHTSVNPDLSRVQGYLIPERYSALDSAWSWSNSLSGRT